MAEKDEFKLQDILTFNNNREKTIFEVGAEVLQP